MPFKEPFVLGPFSVDAAGRLSLARDDVPPRFSIKWRGRVVHVSLANDKSRTGCLHLQTGPGSIPSTAVCDPERRLTALAVFRGLPRLVPSTWQFRVLPDHKARLEAVTAIAMPITVSGLATELASFLLDLDPYLDVLDAAGASHARGTA